MSDNNFAERLATWYSQNKRDLPWRKTQDPYKIWVSEIILQQTRVSQGLPYYKKFITKFPNVNSLADAKEPQLLLVWQGLGYYSRAINMHRCAQIIVNDYESNFPRSYEELINLPGIGYYTAAAISSFCYNEKAPVIDGNVFRVISRIFGLKEDISKGPTRLKFKNVLDNLISKDSPGIFNQGMMEFGALVCTPQEPQCANCIFRSICFAFKYSQQKNLPVKRKKINKTKRKIEYAVFNNNANFLMKRREEKDIWHGLYDFYSFGSDDNHLTDYIKNASKKVYRHQLTHQEIDAKFYLVQVDNDEKFKELEKTLNLKSYSVDEIEKLPKPKLIWQYLYDSKF